MKNIYIQKSFDNNCERGVLYLVGTPIGNLEDITYRAIRTLNEVEIIAAEDTRQTLKLLNHFEINKQLTSYHEHNKESSGAKLLAKLKEGKNIALVSDAGLPAISDPGHELVKMAIQANVKVIPIPGPNAALSALICSGISTNKFVFIGFLSREKNIRKNELEQVKYYKETIIIYESPYRIKKTLEAIYEILGNREISLSRELTKIYEEFIHGSIKELIEYFDKNLVKGEITIIIEGMKEEFENQTIGDWWSQITLVEHVNHYIDQGKKSKDAIKEVAIDRNLSRRDVYQEFHINSKED